MLGVLAHLAKSMSPHNDIPLLILSSDDDPNLLDENSLIVYKSQIEGPLKM